jgi:excisionase family DNA binding protein
VDATTDHGSPLVTRQEAAAYLAVSPTTIKRMQHDGRLSLVYLGGCVRVRLRELHYLSIHGTAVRGA